MEDIRWVANKRPNKAMRSIKSQLPFAFGRYWNFLYFYTINLHTDRCIGLDLEYKHDSGWFRACLVSLLSFVHYWCCRQYDVCTLGRLFFPEHEAFPDEFVVAQAHKRAIFFRVQGQEISVPIALAKDCYSKRERNVWFWHCIQAAELSQKGFYRTTRANVDKLLNSEEEKAFIK
jgi:hypothetical protein